MENALDLFLRVCKAVLNVVASAALTFMMFLTVADIVCRALGHPLVGTYEVVSLALALVIGFGIPRVSLDKSHVYMEIVLEKVGMKAKAVLNTFTRLICLCLFILISYNLFSIGAEFHTSGEVSPTIRLPFYPIAYAVGVCCFIECVVFISQLVKIWRGHYE